MVEALAEGLLETAPGEGEGRAVALPPPAPPSLLPEAVTEGVRAGVAEGEAQGEALAPLALALGAGVALPSAALRVAGGV